MDSTTLIDKQFLLGHWITEYIKQYLDENKKRNADKVLLKVDNISYEYAPAILKIINSCKESLSVTYEPVIKTVSPIEGFEQFSCRDYETSVWLRNFIKPGQALILLLNKKTPESQSLKDIISIDEAQLLAPKGFEALAEMMTQQDLLSVSEINELRRFLDVYQTITDSQLSLILNFLKCVIQSDTTLMISERIGRNLDQLKMFKDESIRTDNKGILRKSLQKNYLLSHLRKSNVHYLDPEKLLQSVDRFVQHEQDTGYNHEVWDIFGRDETELLKKAAEFVHRKNTDLLAIPFSIAEKLFAFKLSIPFKDRLMNMREQVLVDFNEKISNASSKEESEQLANEKMRVEEELDAGIEAVIDKNSLEKIREFREEFGDQIDREGIARSIINIENKLENPSNYVSFLDGVFAEILVMLEKVEEEDYEGNLSFVVRKSSKEAVPTKYVDFLNFHLQAISLLSNNIIIEKIKEQDSDASVELKDTFSFEIALLQNEKKIDSTLFHVDTLAMEMDKNTFFDFYYEILENNKLGFVTVEGSKRNAHFFEEELQELEAASKLGDQKLLPHIEEFQQFNQVYIQLLKELIEYGLNVSRLKEISNLVDNYLSAMSTEVNAVRKISGLINKMGVVEYEETEQQAAIKRVHKKVLSVFNPARLVAYGYKLVHFGQLISKLCDTSNGMNPVRSIEDIQRYRLFENSKMNKLAPAYLASGHQNIYYFEQEESYGQGVYVTEEYKESDSNQATYFAEEMMKISKDYLKVYPYASDCLDILFLYVTNLDYVKKSIEALLKKHTIKKLNVTLHSPAKAAVLYDELNQWLSAKEEYVTPLPLLGGLPRLEINVLPHHSEENLERKISKAMMDFDIAIFVDYFGQKSNLNVPKSFYPVQMKECALEDEIWKKVDETGYRSSQEGTRLINYVSDTQPSLYRKFYDLQYILQQGVAIQQKDTTNILRGEIQVTFTERNALYNLVHEKFNWVVTYDRYMDPQLVNQVTNKANIIRYHIDRKGKDEVKVLVSSSESVKRYIDKEDNYYYHERLSNRLKHLLAIDIIDEGVIRDIIHRVKELSGSSVLRSLGPGKFVHELLSIYLTIAKDNSHKDNEVILWSICDELEWFRKNQKRPDLLKLVIRYSPDEKKYDIVFKLIELKLVHYNSYESEVADAAKQLISGEKTLKQFFEFDSAAVDKELRLQTLITYLMDTRAYSEREISILSQLKNDPQFNIEFHFEKEINAYIYSQDVQFDGKQMVELGFYQDHSDFDEVITKTFTRSFILNSLKVENKVTADSEITETEEMTPFEQFLLDQDIIKEREEGKEYGKSSEEEPSSVVLDDQDPSGVISDVEEKKEKQEIDSLQGLDDESNVEPLLISSDYPELEALKDIVRPESDQEKQKEDEELGKRYGNILRSKFNINGIKLMIEQTIVGANVIRIIASIPPNQSFESIRKKAQDMALWLHVDSVPKVFIDKNIVIDINRPEPETIFFDQFMKLVREQVSEARLNEEFVVPIGLDPLNAVMTVDFNGTEPHMLVAGSTGSGKSVSLNSIVFSMMCLYKPKDLQFVFIDPKKVEFTAFTDTMHTRHVATEINSAADYLDELVEEMEHRYTLLSKEYAKNLKEYNEILKSEGRENETLPRIVIVFDEFADFMLQEKEFAKRIENTIARIGQKGRAAGLHMIVCTQSPKAEIINTTIKNNLLARLGLKVTDSTASNVVLDTSGAEHLAGKGDYLLKAGSEPVRGKSPYLQPTAYRALMKYFEK
ncbi:FtsK/SpoIIIE domain-containing protein [Bacillus sp. FJAT-42315]|uniref:FtsK/SpoIIIE domain-containing protein n=1 Tax=Bacillus sp. FJAT-42315 TaxID=2014077 RepID=UPI0012FE9758|nr:FtsK/SpoIIIE domain-containing protein [Bacillus sp. FJAT-42315]